MIKKTVPFFDFHTPADVWIFSFKNFYEKIAFSKILLTSIAEQIDNRGR